METKHRLVVVREDGLSHTSDFAGWHSETAVYRFFTEAKTDARTLTAVVFEAVVHNERDPVKWTGRSEYSRAAEATAAAFNAINVEILT